MIEYEKNFSSADNNKAKIVGLRCDRCGYIQLDSDDDIWSIVGL